MNTVIIDESSSGDDWLRALDEDFDTRYPSVVVRPIDLTDDDRDFITNPHQPEEYNLFSPHDWWDQWIELSK